MLYYADTTSDIISSDRPAQPAGWLRRADN